MKNDGQNAKAEIILYVSLRIFVFRNVLVIDIRLDCIIDNNYTS